MELPRAPRTLDAVLDAHAGVLGVDRLGYGNHCHRVFGFAMTLAPELDAELLAVTCAFHDLGIWTDGTFDYLAPSIRLAASWLRDRGREADVDAVTRAIDGHHKLTRHASEEPLVEVFRRADWTDVTFGVRRFGLPRERVRAAYAAFPDAGFHRRLLGGARRRFLRHPLSPLPMLRL